VTPEGNEFFAIYVDYGLDFDVIRVLSREQSTLPPVPLPAGGLLLPAALLAFAALRRRRRGAWGPDAGEGPNPVAGCPGASQSRSARTPVPAGRLPALG
jgi:hypothetical protein